VDTQKRSIVGDNVFVLTCIMGLVLILAVVGIILNILIRDGPDVPQELDFLEGLIGGGVAFLGLLSAFYAWLEHKGRLHGAATIH
jgi:hypothetical protein